MARPKKITPAAPFSRASTVNEWLAQQEQLDTLRFITCGGAGDGKSTLIGRLLWELRLVPDDQLRALQEDSRRCGPLGDDINYALLVDGLVAEREQGHTIDVAYRYFATTRRKFIAGDTPGSVQHTRNMLTGASTAEVIVLLVDARHGLLTQTRRHAQLASLTGIRHVILAVNKMDLIGYGRSTFDAMTRDFSALAKSLGFQSVTAIPLSALKGDNVLSRSMHMPWYAGPTLMECLETIEIEPVAGLKAAFPVQTVIHSAAGFLGLSGPLASGQMKMGDTVRITASGQTATIARLMTADGDLLAAAAGDAITLVLDREVDAARGDVIALADQPLEMTDQFEATLIWLHDEPGLVGRSFDIKLATQWATASITSLKYRIDVDTQAHESCRRLGINDIAVANLAIGKPLVFAPHAESAALGSFILVDKFNHATVAAGMIRHNLRRAQNVHRQALSITREDREKLNGHPGKVIWFTGLSGSGKSTIANALEKELHARGKRTYILDGDNIRQGINKDLGFTDADRVENIRRVAEVAKLMMDAGLIVITAFISPFRAERQMARERIGEDHFVEVFVDTPLEVCEQRDPKGLYKKARSGQLPNMTGINSPYERPVRPELVVPHGSVNLEAAVELVTSFLQR